MRESRWLSRSFHATSSTVGADGGSLVILCPGSDGRSRQRTLQDGTLCHSVWLDWQIKRVEQRRKGGPPIRPIPAGWSPLCASHAARGRCPTGRVGPSRRMAGPGIQLRSYVQTSRVRVRTRRLRAPPPRPRPHTRTCTRPRPHRGRSSSGDPRSGPAPRSSRRHSHHTTARAPLGPRGLPPVVGCAVNHSRAPRLMAHGPFRLLLGT